MCVLMRCCLTMTLPLLSWIFAIDVCVIFIAHNKISFSIAISYSVYSWIVHSCSLECMPIFRNYSWIPFPDFYVLFQFYMLSTLPSITKMQLWLDFYLQTTLSIYWLEKGLVQSISCDSAITTQWAKTITIFSFTKLKHW